MPLRFRITLILLKFCNRWNCLIIGTLTYNNDWKQRKNKADEVFYLELFYLESWSGSTMLMSTKSGHCHGIARFLSILSCSASLSYTSISAGVIVAVTFEQVDGSPDAKACSKGHHQGLQYSDCAVEKCHIIPFRIYSGAIAYFHSWISFPANGHFLRPSIQTSRAAGRSLPLLTTSCQELLGGYRSAASQSPGLHPMLYAALRFAHPRSPPLSILLYLLFFWIMSCNGR